MGGKPLTALNIVCFPICEDPQVVREILSGGMDKITEAGALLVGRNAMEMAKASEVNIHLNYSKLSIIPDAEQFADMDIVPSGTYHNRRHYLENYCLQLSDVGCIFLLTSFLETTECVVIKSQLNFRTEKVEFLT